MTLRLAQIGVGYFGSFQLAAWQRIPGVVLVGLADADGARACRVAAPLGVPAFDEPGAMIEALRPDLVDIATPEASHAALVRRACELGVPTIVCQKPLADLATATAMVALAQRAGSRLVVHENWRFQPWYREARRLLDAGALGRPYGLSFRIRPGDGQGASAYLDRQPYFRQMPRFLVHETGIHLIDTFRYLLGEITAVTARLRRLNPAIAGEDAGYLLLDFASGAAGMIDGNRLSDHEALDQRLTLGTMLLEGEAATLRLDGRGRLWLKPHLGPARQHPFDWAPTGPGGGSVEAFQRHVVAHLLDGRPLETEARHYLANLRVEDAAYRSHATGAVVPLGTWTPPSRPL
jgi:predicted dehydrogenase